MPHRMHRNANAAPAGARRSPRRRARPEWVRGTLVGLDVDGLRVTLRVEEARCRRVRVQDEIALDVAGAALQVGDGDGDGRAGLSDLFPGDRVHADLVPEVAGSGIKASRVIQRSEAGPVGGLGRLWRQRPS